MRTKITLMAVACGLMLAAGCNSKTVDKMAFKSAINNYYSTRQTCVWSTPVKFPAEADTSNTDQTKGFDAMTDAGLLTRTPAEKKRFLIGSKQVNMYDLSAKGHSSWTADTSQPGYGNFCFGHREVTTIDGYTPSDNTDATQYNVTFHSKVSSVPDWAQTAEMKAAFPRINDDTSGEQAGTATLAKSSNGWQVQNVQPSGDASPAPAPGAAGDAKPVS
jgi:hypothetical protein